MIEYSTVQKVNYTRNGSSYSVASFVTTNSGDGTVTATSAQNNLLPNDAHVAMLSGIGSHVDMISNPNALTQICQYTSRALSGTLSRTMSEQPIDELHENERGWIVGGDLDGRRIRVIVRGSNLPVVLTDDGNECVLVEDRLYCGGQASEENFVGNCWKVSDGYQFEMLNGEYTYIFRDGGEGLAVEVMYMENGYYETMENYEVDSTGAEYCLEISDFSEFNVTMMDSNDQKIEQSRVVSVQELQEMNRDR